MTTIMVQRAGIPIGSPRLGSGTVDPVGLRRYCPLVAERVWSLSQVGLGQGDMHKAGDA